jgi:hypothetical protein
VMKILDKMLRRTLVRKERWRTGGITYFLTTVANSSN